MLGARLTADVDHAGRSQPAQVGQERLARTGARRVHEHDVELFAGARHAREHAAGVADHELGVFDAVDAGVLARVVDGFAVALDAEQLGAALLGRHNADRPGTAVGVADAVARLDVGEFDREFVERFGGDGVGLVEGRAADAEAAAAQLIFDVARAVEHLLLTAQDHARALAVHVEHDGRDLGMGFEQPVDEHLGARDAGPVAHQGEHDLVGHIGGPHEGVAQQPLAGLLVVGLDVEAREQAGDRGDDGTGAPVFDKALGAGDDVVRPTLEDAPARGGAAVATGTARGEGELDLVAEVPRVVHAENGVGLALVVREQLFDVVLLAVELLVVGHGEPFAAAAALGDGAAHFDAALVGVFGTGVVERLAVVAELPVRVVVRLIAVVVVEPVVGSFAPLVSTVEVAVLLAAVATRLLLVAVPAPVPALAAVVPISIPPAPMVPVVSAAIPVAVPTAVAVAAVVTGAAAVSAPVAAVSAAVAVSPVPVTPAAVGAAVARTARRAVV